MRRLEQRVQQQIVRWCHNNLAPEVIFWANYQNAHSAMQGGINKSMGVKKGVADMTFSWGKNIGFMEIKAEGGSLSKEQAQFLDEMALRGHYTAVPYSLDAAIKVLTEWELPRAKYEAPEIPF